jgi:hypothetical protein
MDATRVTHHGVFVRQTLVYITLSLVAWGVRKAELGLTAHNADRALRKSILQGGLHMPYEVMCPLIVGMDSLYFSCDLLLSQAMIAKLAAEKVTAQGMGKQAHCPEWLGARASAPRGPGHVTRHLRLPMPPVVCWCR